MISAAFIFIPGAYDDAFRALDALIEEAAEQTPGYLGVDRWVSEDGAKRNSTYYWTDAAALEPFARHPKHIEAKRRYREWYDGFHVVISEVVKSYGDGAIAHATPNGRARPDAARAVE